jgi:histidine ammonia-lyase
LSSAHLEHVHEQLRREVPFFDADRFFAPDIEAAKQMVITGQLSASCKELFAALYR